MDKARVENESLKLSLERNDTLINLRNQEIAALNSRLAAKDETIAEASEQCDEFEKWWKEEEAKVADRDKEIANLRSELADLKQNSATASQDLPDLTEKAGELLSFFKSLLPKNTKLPNGIISKIEKILEG